MTLLGANSKSIGMPCCCQGYAYAEFHFASGGWALTSILTRYAAGRPNNGKMDRRDRRHSAGGRAAPLCDFK
jgi:hypothetical protein